MLSALSVIGSALLLSTGVLSDIPQGEWISPEVDIKLVETIDVTGYGEPVTNMLGRVSFVETEDGEKWRLVLVNKSNITIVEENQEARQISYNTEVDRYVMSPENGYVVLIKRYNFEYCLATRINTHNGEIVEFQPYPDGCYLGTILVSNSGSIISSHEEGISLFDSNLVLRCNLDEYAEKGNNHINRNSTGSRIYVTDGLSILAYDTDGNIIWNQDGIELPNDLSYFQKNGYITGF